MRLVRVQIRDFRSIEDSGEFSVHPVTCLVGKNESGKTAILKALQKLKPDNPAKESFSPSRDYPRRKWRPNTPIPNDPPAVKTVWELTDSEIAEIEAIFGKGVISNRQFSLSKPFGS